MIDVVGEEELIEQLRAESHFELSSSGWRRAFHWIGEAWGDRGSGEKKAVSCVLHRQLKAWLLSVEVTEETVDLEFGRKAELENIWAASLGGNQNKGVDENAGELVWEKNAGTKKDRTEIFTGWRLSKEASKAITLKEKWRQPRGAEESVLSEAKGKKMFQTVGRQRQGWLVFSIILKKE